MSEGTLDVVHVGSASRDLTDDDPRGWRLGGGASYAALTTARLGLRTAAMVGVDSAAASASELELLRAAGVELVLVALEEGPVFRNRETSAGRIQTSVAVGRPLPVPRVPRHWARAAAWSLVPVAGELDEAWASVVPDEAFVSLGWQGQLRVLVAGADVERLGPRPSRLVGRADLIGVSRHDLAPGTRPAGLLRFLRSGARLVVTDGLDGGRMLRGTVDGRVRTREYAAVAADREIDPTGAGDVFLAALVASYLRAGAEEHERASARVRFDLRFAAIAASLVVEAPGLHGVPDLAAVLARARPTRPAR